MHFHICLRKSSHYDAYAIQPDRNQLVYSRNGYHNLHRTPEREVRGSFLTRVAMNICVLEQSTGNTHEAVAPSRHNLKIDYRDVKQ